MTATTLPPLSSNDLAILGALFDPETSLSRSSKPNPTNSQPKSSKVKSHDTIKPPLELLHAEKAILQTLNTATPTPETLTHAISQLTTLIEQHPDSHPSLYINRAQATRLLPSSLTTPKHIHSILRDLQTALTIPNANADPSLLITAHKHRAYILLSISQQPEQFAALTSSLDTTSANTLEALGFPSVSDLTTGKLEDLASRDFAAAGALGDDEARKMSVRTNPYAKMCGAIVREALREEIREYYGDGL